MSWDHHWDYRALVIETARQLLVNFLSARMDEWWERRRTRAEARARLSSVDLSDREVERLVDEVLREIQILARDVPDVKCQDGSLWLLRPPPPYAPADDDWNRRVRQRRQALEDLVAKRYRQAGLSVDGEE